MKYFFVIILSIILPILSLKNIKPKLCINCKHFIPDNNNINIYGKDSNNIYGKCSLFPKEESKFNFLVNGINEQMYYFCSTARQNEHMCGEKGNLYKKKYVLNNKNSTK